MLYHGSEVISTMCWMVQIICSISHNKINCFARQQALPHDGVRTKRKICQIIDAGIRGGRIENAFSFELVHPFPLSQRGLLSWEITGLKARSRLGRD